MPLASEDFIRLGAHLVPIDLPSDPVRIGTYANTPRDILLNHDVRIGWFHMTPDLFSKKPRITSATSLNAKVNTSFSYQITATNSPDSFDAHGLPPGLSVNTTTGEISGTPTTLGTTSVTVEATNTEGTGSRVISIRVGDVPTVTSTSASGTVNTAFSYQVVATGGPFTSFSATGLPAGLSINNSGLITGRATATGTTPVQVTATNVFGTSAPQTMSISITAPAAGPQAFYGPLPNGTTVAELREPDFIKGLPAFGNPVAGTVLVASLPTGSQGVLFAYPATLGPGTSAIQTPPGFDVIAGLVKEIIQVQPGVNYQVVYQQVPLAYSSPVTYTFTI